MIITNEMLDTVMPFNEDEISRIDFPEQSKRLEELLFIEGVKLYSYWYGSDPKNKRFYLETNRLYVEVYHLQNDESFTGVSIIGSESTLNFDDYIEIGIQAGTIKEHKSAILSIVTPLIPIVEDHIKKEEVKSSARWCYRRIKEFFQTYSTDNKTVDTEKVLKAAWKEPMDGNSVPFFVTRSSGKHDSFKTIRKVIDRFYETYQNILALQEKQTTLTNKTQPCQ